jgi:hypothetical protein
MTNRDRLTQQYREHVCRALLAYAAEGRPLHIESDRDGDELEIRFRLGDADALQALLEQKEPLDKDGGEASSSEP